MVYANFSNNKLVTASGSTTLNGDGALTFDSLNADNLH